MNEDSVINFLAMTSGEELRNLLRTPAATLASYVQTEFPSGENMAPGSQESAEAAAVDEQREGIAAVRWERLEPAEQERLLETLAESRRADLRARLEGRLW